LPGTPPGQFAFLIFMFSKLLNLLTPIS